MANNYKNTSLFDELCGSHKGTDEPQQADKPAEASAHSAYSSVQGEAVPQAIGSSNTLYDGRTIRPAGHMVVGARAPVPRPDDAGLRMKGFESAQLFSSKNTDRRRITGSGAAVALACAVTVGSTAVFTSTIGSFSEQKNLPGNIEQAGIASEFAEETYASTATTNQEVVNAIIADELGSQSSRQDVTEPLQVASLGPVTLPNSANAANPHLVRVAQHDAKDLKVSNISGTPGADLPINISLKESSSEAYSFIMIRGLPADITLSAGFRLKESWAVSLRDVSALSLKSPPTFEGNFDLEILLIKGRNTPAVSQVMNVSIHPEQQPPQQKQTIAAAKIEPQIEKPAAPARIEPARAEPSETRQVLTAAPAAIDPVQELKVEKTTPAQPAQRRPALAQPQAPQLQISVADETALFDKAQTILNNGDIASARLLLEHLSGKGSVKATFALAQTFDPEFFSKMNVIGLRPDPAKAKQWYAKASAMGNAEANARLSALESR